MAYKQPRVPQLTEGAPVEEYLRNLIMFLRDDCMSSWMESRKLEEALAALKKETGSAKDGIDSTNEQINSLRDEIGLARADIDSMRTEIDLMKEEIAAMKQS